MAPCIIASIYLGNDLIRVKALNYETFDQFIQHIMMDLNAFNRFIEKELGFTYKNMYSPFNDFDLKEAIKRSAENKCLDRYFKIGCDTNYTLEVKIIPTVIIQ